MIRIHELIFGKANPRVAGLPLYNSPLPMWIITLSYLVFVLKLGPAYMKNRPAYKLKYILFVYNLIQIIANFGYHIMSCHFVWYSGVYDLFCWTNLPNGHPMIEVERRYYYGFLILRIFDYLDTVFFVLRKSYRQVTYLHIYHHLLVVMGGYYYLWLNGSGGPVGILGLLNSFVHGCMYSYYFAAALRPSMKKQISWKQYITLLQLLQFLLLGLSGFYTLLFRSECPISRPLICFGVSQVVIMSILFFKFYWNAYVKPKRQSMQKIK